MEHFKEITLFKATKEAGKGDDGSKFLLRRTKHLIVSLHRIYATPLKSISLLALRGNLQGAFCWQRDCSHKELSHLYNQAYS